MKTPAEIKSILIRLPNWLGDMIMSSAFIRALKQQYPDAVVDIIVKKELAALAAFFQGISQVYEFSKTGYPGISGIKKFGKMIAGNRQYDLFFCLPDSFSSALMGYYTKSTIRAGYKKEGRSFLLTKSWKKPENLHRVEEYTNLLSLFTGKENICAEVKLKGTGSSLSLPYGKNLVFNINSEAPSRRLPLEKAREITSIILKQTDYNVVMIGSYKETGYVNELITKINNQERVCNIAGKTNLTELAELLNNVDLMISTDSGPAHLANSLGTPLIVFFGAGHEKNTGPYNKEKTIILKADDIECAPCYSNFCKYDSPLCLLKLNSQALPGIISKLLKYQF